MVSTAAPLLAYRIAASSGDMLSLRSTSSTPGFSSQMELYDPTGVRLDSGVFSLSRKVAASGNYTVMLGAAAPRTAGGYSFAWQLLNQPAGASPAACGGSTTGALSASNQFRYYTLAADAGDILRLLFTRISDNFSPQIEIFDPTGARIAANSDVTQKVSAGRQLSSAGQPVHQFHRDRSLHHRLPAAQQSLLAGLADLRPDHPAPGDHPRTTRHLHLQRHRRRRHHHPADRALRRLLPLRRDVQRGRHALTTSSNGLLRSVLPADGVYTLLVRDRSAVNLGSYRVSLQDDTNACPVNDTRSPRDHADPPHRRRSSPRRHHLPHTVAVRRQRRRGSARSSRSRPTRGKTFADPFASLGGNQQTYDWILPATSRPAAPRSSASPPPMPPATPNPPPATC